jgi:hypothetical protein
LKYSEVVELIMQKCKYRSANVRFVVAMLINNGQKLTKFILVGMPAPLKSL